MIEFFRCGIMFSPYDSIPAVREILFCVVVISEILHFPMLRRTVNENDDCTMPLSSGETPAVARGVVAQEPPDPNIEQVCSFKNEYRY